MNDTKWNELRQAMLALEPSPRWRTRDVATGYESLWDREWAHHFRVGGYETIEWVEIEAADPSQADSVQMVLARVHVPGVRTEVGFKVFGYIAPGTAIQYVSPPNNSLQRP